MVRFDGLIIFNIGLVLSPRPFLLPLLSKYFLIWQLSNYLDDLDDLGRETWNVEYIEKKIVQNKRKDKRFVRSYNIYRSVQVTKFRSVNSQPNDVFFPVSFRVPSPKRDTHAQYVYGMDGETDRRRKFLSIAVYQSYQSFSHRCRGTLESMCVVFTN